MTVITTSITSARTIVDDILDASTGESKGIGTFQRRLLFLCGMGYFAVCAELLVLVFISDSVQREWTLSRAEYAWLPILSTLSSYVLRFDGFVFGLPFSNPILTTTGIVDLQVDLSLATGPIEVDASARSLSRFSAQR